MKTLILLLLLLPVAASAQIFRCAARGDTYYSQIPCADNAREVVIEDHPMFSEAAPATREQPDNGNSVERTARTPVDNLKEFISTLRRQRGEQLQQLDSDIAKLEAQLHAAGHSPAEVVQRKASSQQLSDLQASRSSIVEQYDSMLAEAERRVAALETKQAGQLKPD